MLQYKINEPFASGGVAELHFVTLADGRKALLRRLLPNKVFHLCEHLGFRNGLKVRQAVSPHRNIVKSFEWGYHFLRPYEIIEYIPGENLKVLYNMRGKLLLEHAAVVLEAAACGLAWVHNVGYMHLDVKPENFLCQERARPIVKLTDFDLARPGDDCGPRRQMGTPAYMAPEQFVQKTSSMASDVFAFSIMAYQIFTWKMPFSGDSPKATWRHQASETVIPKPPVSSNPEMPPKWNAAIVKGLEKRQEKRLPDMNAFLDMVKS